MSDLLASQINQSISQSAVTEPEIGPRTGYGALVIIDPVIDTHQNRRECRRE